MENHENLIGRVLGERYKVEAIVGEGGMSVVMRALDTVTSKNVTIKLLDLKNNAEHNAVERFTNEAKAVSLLSHPNIVSVHDVSLDGPDKYIVMEYINGITLKEYLDKVGRLEWKEAVHYINQVLSALSHAHEKGVIHRDIKPENVMLMRNGSIKVIDFGIAKLPDSKSLTVIDKAIGTVNYISPEQASGSRSNEKSDIYSTGIMLYELVTGQLPFVSSSSVAVAMMHVSSEPAMPTSICESIPKGLEQVIIKSMMKNPDYRFGSAAAMKKALDYLTVYPNTVFKEKPPIGPDGKPILGTGATGNTSNNTVLTSGIAPLTNPEEQETQSIDFSNNPITADDDEEDILDKQNSEADEEDDENEEDDDEYAYVKPAKPTMFPIVLGVTIAFFTILVLVLILAWKSFGQLFFPEEKRDSEANTITIPNLVHAEYSDNLVKQLEEMGFLVSKVPVVNENVQEGYIVSQDPLPDSTRKRQEKGVKLVLEVSTSSTDVIMKDYTNIEQSVVKAMLEKEGLIVEVETRNDNFVIKNHVIQTEPKAGKPVLNGRVTLYVSKGPAVVPKDGVKIPDEILGMSLNDAVELLTGLNIACERCDEADEIYSDEYDERTVAATYPEVGEIIDINQQDTPVILIISKGPEPTYGPAAAEEDDDDSNKNDNEKAENAAPAEDNDTDKKDDDTSEKDDGKATEKDDNKNPEDDNKIPGNVAEDEGKVTDNITIQDSDNKVNPGTADDNKNDQNVGTDAEKKEEQTSGTDTNKKDEQTSGTGTDKKDEQISDTDIDNKDETTTPSTDTSKKDETTAPSTDTTEKDETTTPGTDTSNKDETTAPSTDTTKKEENKPSTPASTENKDTSSAGNTSGSDNASSAAASGDSSSSGSAASEEDSIIIDYDEM